MNLFNIQNKILEFIKNNTAVQKTKAVDDFDKSIFSSYNFDNFNANSSDEEYLSNLISDFLSLQEVIDIADTDKNGVLSDEEKNNFLANTLNINDEKFLNMFDGMPDSDSNIFLNNNIDNTSTDSSSLPSNSGNKGDVDGSKGSGKPPRPDKSSSSDDEKLKNAEIKMNNAEKAYMDSVQKDSDNVKLLEEQRTATVSDIDLKKSEIENNQSEILTLTGETEKIGNEIASLQSQLSVLSSKKFAEDDIEGQNANKIAIDKINADISALQSEKAEKERQIDEKNAKISELESGIGESEKKLSEIETEISKSCSDETKKLLDDYQSLRSEYEKILKEVQEKEKTEEKNKIESEEKALDDDVDFNGVELTDSDEFITVDGTKITAETAKKNIEKVLDELDINGDTSYFKSSDGKIVVVEKGDGYENRYRITADGDVVGYKTVYGTFEENADTVDFYHSDKKGKDVKTSLPIQDIESYIKNIKAGNSNGVNVESLLNTAMTYFDNSAHKGERDHCVLYTKDVMSMYGFDVPGWSYYVYSKNERVESGNVQPGDIYISTNYESSMKDKNAYKHVGIVASEIPAGNGEYCYITIDFAASGMSVNVHSSEEKSWYEYRKP